MVVLKAILALRSQQLEQEELAVVEMVVELMEMVRIIMELTVQQI